MLQGETDCSDAGHVTWLTAIFSFELGTPAQFPGFRVLPRGVNRVVPVPEKTFAAAQQNGNRVSCNW